MPHKPSSNSYLELHGGSWRVTVGVPKPLVPLLGTRLKHPLGTDSVNVANREKTRYVRQFKQDIRDAWNKLNGRSRTQIEEAIWFAEELKIAIRKDKLPPNRSSIEIAEIDFDLLADGKEVRSLADRVKAEIRERKLEILLEGAKENYRWIDQVDGADDNEFGEEVQIEDPILMEGARERAKLFEHIALGKVTPISAYHEVFLRTLKIKEKSKSDDRRAVKLLLDWCAKEHYDANLDAIDIAAAASFTENLENFTGLDEAICTKYLGRLKIYLAYLVRRTAVSQNVWADMSINKKHEFAEELERPFTNLEVRRLLMGTTDEKMRDPMLIGALTGARLDAIIDLRVGECADGWFTFKAQKFEAGQRNVPIHPALEKLVERRTKGKSSEDDLFPEWPGPASPESIRERSATYSQRFTTYRRNLGVEEDRESKRRSLVNFHSFRRWFITEGERAGVSHKMIAAIVGHKRDSITLDRYSAGPLVKSAMKAIRKIKLPPLDDSPLPEVHPVIRRSKA